MTKNILQDVQTKKAASAGIVAVNHSGTSSHIHESPFPVSPFVTRLLHKKDTVPKKK